MDIGKRIQELRKQKNLSSIKLANLAEIGQSTISEIERGIKQPTMPTLNKICSALGITLSDFFAEEKKDIPPDLIELIDEAKDLSPEQLEQLTKFLKIMKGK